MTRAVCDKYVGQFVQDNLYYVLQRSSQWIYPDSNSPVEIRLFEAYLSVSGFSSLSVYLKKVSRRSRRRRILQFSLHILSWLRRFYPTFNKQSFFHVDENYFHGVQESVGGRKSLKLSGQGELDLCNCGASGCGDGCWKRHGKIECWLECEGDCGNKASQMPFDWESLLVVFYIDRNIGAGVKAKCDLPAGTFLGKVQGEALDM